MTMDSMLSRSWGHIFDLFADALVISNHDGRILAANQAAREFWSEIPDLVGLELSQLLFGEQGRYPLPALLEHQVFGKPGWFEIHTRQIVLSDKRSAVAHQFTDITARRTAELKLMEKARVYDAMTDAVIITDPTGLITDTNPACERMLGLCAGEAIGKHAGTLFPVVDKPAFMDGVRELLVTGQPWKGELEFATPEGLPGFAEISVVPVVTDDGKMVAFICVWRDVTARIQMERELAESETRHRAIFINSPLPILIEDFSRLKARLDELTASGIGDLRSYLLVRPELILECAALIKVLDVNQAAIDLYGVESKSGLLNNLGLLLPEEAYPDFVEELILIASGQKQITWEGWNSKVSGEMVRVRMHWAVAPITEDEYANVLVSIEDITEQRQMEARIERAKREWEAAFDAVPEMILMTGAEGQVLRCNQAVIKTLKRDFAQVLGHPVERLFGWDATDSGPLSSQAGEVQFTALPGIYSVGSYPLYLPASQLGRIYVISDISAQKQMEDSMMSMEKLATIGTLAAGVAHEMNSPLQVITGLSESLLNRLGTNGTPPDLDIERMRRNMDTIRRSGWRCAEIVRSLLTYARPTASALQEQDLNSVVRDCLLLLEHQLHSWSNIIVESQLCPEALMVNANHNQLVQVMINLLTNARDAMPNGGRIVVSTGMDPSKGQIRLQVTDEGTGMPEEVAAKIFDPFFTTKPFGEGTGLGLSIVLGIVRAHGGDVGVESTPGAGTTFTVLLPSQPLSVLTGLPGNAGIGRYDD